jgi:hypothetical protein
MTIQADESVAGLGARVMAQVQLSEPRLQQLGVEAEGDPQQQMQIFVDALEADSRFTEVLAEVMPVFRQLDADKRTVPVLMGRLQKALDSRIDARMESTLRQAAAGLTIGGASSAKGRPSAAAEVASKVADGKKIWMPRKGGKKALQAGLSMMDQSAKDQTLEPLLEEKGLTGQALGGAGRVGCIGQVEEGVAAVAALVSSRPG